MATTTAPDGSFEREGPPPPPLTALERTWAPRPGLIGWLSVVNHRQIGVRYITTAMAFFLLAGLLALAMRLQLALPGLGVLSPELYNQYFTMHGTTMMFLFALPVMEGIGIYLVPLMIGARDAAFPRLNAFGYFVYLIAGVTLYFSFFTAQAPDGGWFAYVPLSNAEYSTGNNLDFWTTAITFLEIAALVAAVELIVTIFRMRAPGMGVQRMPALVWAILVMAFMIVFAMPPLMLASVFLALDRMVGTHFFRVEGGGDPLLWQHLFWFFGHPDVYIIFIPALGIAAMVTATFARRPLVGYTPFVLSVVAVGILSFGLWVHHMYTTGLPQLGMSFFAAASMMIGLPSGVIIFGTIATIWLGRPLWKTPLLYIVGFVIVFVIGGITGIMVAAVPFDHQVHDSYFVVAHFHYVLIGGAVFPLFAGLHYWWPKITGRMPGESLGRWSFWLTFVGFHITFFTMHITGLLGMPRRVYTYPAGLGWEALNMVSTVGSFILGVGMLAFVANLLLSLRGGERAGDNPWGAGTLEWATSSPPPQYNFARIPGVASRDPLWDEGGPAGLYSLRDDRRESLGTSLLDADPEQRLVLPGPSIWPFLLALAVGLLFIGTIISLWAVPIGFALAVVAVVGWLWPTREQLKREDLKS
ncbi:MAG TPA: cytochrome c oxidase subunit I [Chloroflexaceae bacterium]|nr:cytochrome c oxidase subunit I [Chloroflexaceae bacterium]